MKASHAWIARLALCSASTFLSAQTLSETILSQNQRQQLDYLSEKSELESQKLRDSWLNPVMMGYQSSFKTQYGQDQESYSAQVGIDQPIFKSGGIYFAINYAKAKAHYDRLGVVTERKRLIKEALETAMRLRMNRLDQAVQNLRIEDQEKQIRFNQEQLQAQEIDPAVLEQNMIRLNDLKIELLGLKSAETTLRYQFSIYSDEVPEQLTLPKLTLIEKDQYSQKNIPYKQALAKQEENRYFKNMTISKYLPTLNVNVSYNYSESVNQTFAEDSFVFNASGSYTSYGFSISMPLYDVNMMRDIQSSRVDYLKSSVTIAQLKEDEKNFYDAVMARFKMIEQKKELALNNQRLYKKLFAFTQDAFSAGEKNSLELDQSRHQMEINSMIEEKYNFEAQIELLALYEKFYDL